MRARHLYLHDETATTYARTECAGDLSLSTHSTALRSDEMPRAHRRDTGKFPPAPSAPTSEANRSVAVATERGHSSAEYPLRPACPLLGESRGQWRSPGRWI